MNKILFVLSLLSIVGATIYMLVITVKEFIENDIMN